jgi:hypothetical protein
MYKSKEVIFSFVSKQPSSSGESAKTHTVEPLASQEKIPGNSREDKAMDCLGRRGWVLR